MQAPIEKPEFRENLSNRIKANVVHLGYVGDVEDPILQVWFNRYAIAGGYVEWLEKENEKLHDRIARAQGCLVCMAIDDPAQIVQNTLEILEEGKENE